MLPLTCNIVFITFRGCTENSKKREKQSVRERERERETERERKRKERQRERGKKKRAKEKNNNKQMEIFTMYKMRKKSKYDRCLSINKYTKKNRCQISNK